MNITTRQGRNYTAAKMAVPLFLVLLPLKKKIPCPAATVAKIVVKILLHADTPCMNANTGRHLSIPSCHICINTINASIYALHGVYFLQSLFVDENVIFVNLDAGFRKVNKAIAVLLLPRP